MRLKDWFYMIFVIFFFSLGYASFKAAAELIKSWEQERTKMSQEKEDK